MKNILIAALIGAMLNALGWFLARETTEPPSARDAIGSVSYTPGPPEYVRRPATPEILARIDRDMARISTITSGVRLYSSDGLTAEIPAIAKQHGLSVVAGAWVSRNVQATERELQAAITLVNRNQNVRAIIVGNETILRKELEAAQLIEQLRKVRRRVRVPVSTGETWDLWLKHPELVREVDFIAAHILPYWEGIPDHQALEYALGRYEALRAAYPGKRVVIAEFGWPSRGYNIKAASPGPTRQATLIREFVNAAGERDISVNIIEAFDQPWKTREGSVGAYWGLFDATGKLKFPLEGKVREVRFYHRLISAIAIGAAVSVLGLAWVRPTFLHALAFSAAANTLAAGVALAMLYPLENYLNVGSALAWAIGFALMVLLTAMTLVKVHEVAEVTLGRRPSRLIRGPVVAPGYVLPKVSVHIPAYRENPEMLISTLDSVAALDYPDFEALVIVNNTPEPSYWRPIEAHCRALGPRFKFVFLPKVAGFKAGALNAALVHMATDASVIALLDADYVVDRNWLKDLVPAFADPKVALVQAPQDHRDGGESVFKQVMNSEYAGFFDIGMVQRNEHDAAIAHGTMLLIRRTAFEQVGGWSTDTITEDTELGLRLFEAGYAAHYTNRRYGWGLLPDDFNAFKTQRHRWVFGAMQIIRKHWRHMLPGAKTLSWPQKIQFVTGWSYWLSDAFGVLAAYMNLMWVPMIVFVGVLIPTLPFTLPILVAFAVNLLHCVLLYGVRVKIPTRHIAGAALAAMSLQLTVARGVLAGLRGGRLVFNRTAKGGLARPWAPESPARAEFRIGVLLFGSAALLLATNFNETTEIKIFATTLFVQGLPFLAAWLVAWLDRRAVILRRALAPA